MANSTLIIASDGNFGPDIDGFVPPVADGLRGWFWFDGDNASAPLNLVTRQRATVVGTPAYDGLSVLLGQGSYFVTDVTEAANQSLYFVASSTAELVNGPSWPMFIGSTDVTAVPGFSVFGYTRPAGTEAPVGNIVARAWYNVNGTPANSATSNNLRVENLTLPHLYSVEYANGVGRTLRNHTTGQVNTYPDTNLRALGNRPIQIGQFGSFSGVNRQWVSAIYEGLHTADQRNAIVDWIRQVLAGDGVTV